MLSSLSEKLYKNMSQTDTKIWLLCLLSIDLIVYTPAASFLGNILFKCAERGSLSVYA